MNEPNGTRRIVREPTTSSQQRPRPPVRRRRRKSNMTLYYIVVVVIVVFAAYFLSNFVFFRIDEIKVTGSTYYAKESILYASTVSKGDNLFRTDIKGIEERLSKMMVYADEVKVRRKLPSKLEITIKEAVPKYNILQDGRYFIISESGKILENDKISPQDNLLVVDGFEIKDTKPGAKLESEDNLKARILTELTENIEGMKFDGILKIDLSDRTDIRLFYKDRIEIRIGSSMDIPYKLRYVRAVIESVERTFGADYEGTLIYHSATSGISAIAKDKSQQTEFTPDKVEGFTENSENEG
ncbi:MAG: FtsQ-type POTRA domain-containing protein [Oscillospiraceae bacterium]|nr:FtsQ-type POTRA domain-containing protein [Oscillospiraceae bacterium]MBQ8378004.1 FtsQ-type POTRA domain-containing protein [Oscillospiraceae bacterium]